MMGQAAVGVSALGWLLYRTCRKELSPTSRRVINRPDVLRRPRRQASAKIWESWRANRMFAAIGYPRGLARHGTCPRPSINSLYRVGSGPGVPLHTIRNLFTTQECVSTRVGTLHCQLSRSTGQELGYKTYTGSEQTQFTVQSGYIK